MINLIFYLDTNLNQSFLTVQSPVVPAVGTFFRFPQQPQVYSVVKVFFESPGVNGGAITSVEVVLQLAP